MPEKGQPKRALDGRRARLVCSKHGYSVSAEPVLVVHSLGVWSRFTLIDPVNIYCGQIAAEQNLDQVKPLHGGPRLVLPVVTRILKLIGVLVQALVHPQDNLTKSFSREWNGMDAEDLDTQGFWHDNFLPCLVSRRRLAGVV